MRIRPAPLLAALLTLSLSACGGDDDCQIVCEKNAECQVESPGEDDCISICEELSGDEGYADALAEQAECYEAESCEAIQNGACVPDFS